MRSVRAWPGVHPVGEVGDLGQGKERVERREDVVARTWERDFSKDASSMIRLRMVGTSKWREDESVGASGLEELCARWLPGRRGATAGKPWTCSALQNENETDEEVVKTSLGLRRQASVQCSPTREVSKDLWDHMVEDSRLFPRLETDHEKEKEGTHHPLSHVESCTT